MKALLSIEMTCCTKLLPCQLFVYKIYPLSAFLLDRQQNTVYGKTRSTSRVLFRGTIGVRRVAWRPRLLYDEKAKNKKENYDLKQTKEDEEVLVGLRQLCETQ